MAVEWTENYEKLAADLVLIYITFSSLYVASLIYKKLLIVCVTSRMQQKAGEQQQIRNPRKPVQKKVFFQNYIFVIIIMPYSNYFFVRCDRKNDLT